jgi:hypothetical protein
MYYVIYIKYFRTLGPIMCAKCFSTKNLAEQWINANTDESIIIITITKELK